MFAPSLEGTTEGPTLVQWNTPTQAVYVSARRGPSMWQQAHDAKIDSAMDAFVVHQSLLLHLPRCAFGGSGEQGFLDDEEFPAPWERYLHAHSRGDVAEKLSTQTPLFNPWSLRTAVHAAPTTSFAKAKRGNAAALARAIPVPVCYPLTCAAADDVCTSTIVSLLRKDARGQLRACGVDNEGNALLDDLWCPPNLRNGNSSALVVEDVEQDIVDGDSGITALVSPLLVDDIAATQTVLPPSSSQSSPQPDVRTTSASDDAALTSNECPQDPVNSAGESDHQRAGNANRCWCLDGAQLAARWATCFDGSVSTRAQLLFSENKSTVAVDAALYPLPICGSAGAFDGDHWKEEEERVGFDLEDSVEFTILEEPLASTCAQSTPHPASRSVSFTDNDADEVFEFLCAQHILTVTSRHTAGKNSALALFLPHCSL